jgi:hypothetical protein
MIEFLIRFLVGGLVVSLFAVLGDVLRPKSFAGLFGAAPSVALATVSLTIHKEGRLFAASEARTMILGAIAFLVYSTLASLILRRRHTSALTTAMILMPAWFGVAFGLLAAFRGRL